MQAFDVLYQAAPSPSSDVLPAALSTIYGGGLSLDDVAVYGNYVQSLDGIATIPGVTSVGSVLSGRDQADRFLMALLRARAAAVLIGGATLRETPGHQWTPEHVYPELSEHFAAYRRNLGLPLEPRLVVLSASGRLDPGHAALRSGALILTSKRSAPRLRDALPSCEVAALGNGPELELDAVLARIHELVGRPVLVEAGPLLSGQMLQWRLLTDVFLTLSPVFAGGGEDRSGVTRGLELLPSAGAWAVLDSVRRHGSHLFLRYRMDRSS